MQHTRQMISDRRSAVQRPTMIDQINKALASSLFAE